MLDSKNKAEIGLLCEHIDGVKVLLLRQQEKIEQLRDEIQKLRCENEELKAAGKKAVVYPIPCRKFRNASALEWITKLMEETHEVAREAVVSAEDENRDKLVEETFAEELTDVITVCTSWLDALGYGEEARCIVQQRVNDKNRKRGYHAEANF